MNILIACEFSGTVRDSFIKKGHSVLSCDLLPTEKKGPHYQGDIENVLYQDWDLIIAHPPCTYFANSGVSWLHKDPARWIRLDEAAEFFKKFLDHPCEKIAVENPVPHKYAVERINDRKYTQTIQPWQFGHPESKRTCLWLKGLPELQPTNILEKPANGKWDNQTPSGQNKLGPSEDRAKIRSLTYQGIADAMAEQWG